MAINQEEAAAAAVSALFFCAALFSFVNVRLTGFKLYIPIGLASLVRGVAFAAAASFAVTHNLDLLGVKGALVAVGLGISIAMCSCFMVIWLRNAAECSRPAKNVQQALSIAGRLLVACVIVFGPILGVTAVCVIYSNIRNPEMLRHGVNIRNASAGGFLAVAAALSCLIGYVTVNWVVRSLSQDSRQHDSEQQQQQERQQTAAAHGDHLIVLLLVSISLLLWSTIIKEDSITHTELTSYRQLFYPLAVLPELVVAFLWAVPTLVPRVALGSRYHQWQQQQAKQQQAAGSDAQAAVVDGASSSKGKHRPKGPVVALDAV